MSLLDRIRKDYPLAIDNECRGSGKNLKKSREARGILIINADKLGREKESKCDCIAIRETARGIIIAVIELKSKTIRPGKAVLQLEGCYSFMQKMLRSYKSGDEIVSYRFAIFA